YAQQTGYKVSGKVVDNHDEKMIGAEITLLQGDSVLLSGFTDAEGSYTFEEIRNGLYLIQATFIGFAQKEISFQVKDQDMELGPIKLNASVENLEGITVLGEVTAVRQNGDTTMYNANAYKTNPDATAEDLVRKMPG